MSATTSATIPAACSAAAPSWAGVSTRRVEDINNKIKLTVRVGYGFRSIDNLIAPVMLRCSNLSITLPGRAQAA